MQRVYKQAHTHTHTWGDDLSLSLSLSLSLKHTMSDVAMEAMMLFDQESLKPPSMQKL